MALIAVVLGTGVGMIAAPGHRSLVLSIGVMSVLACVLVEMGRAAHALSSRGHAWARVRETPALREKRPSDLEHLERVLGWGQYSPGDFNYEVRPLLRRLVAHRLVQAHGIDLDTRPGAARDIVSTELWDSVVAKQPAEAARVIRTDDVVRMVDEIEEIW